MLIRKINISRDCRRYMRSRELPSTTEAQLAVADDCFEKGFFDEALQIYHKIPIKLMNSHQLCSKCLCHSAILDYEGALLSVGQFLNLEASSEDIARVVRMLVGMEIEKETKELLMAALEKTDDRQTLIAGYRALTLASDPIERNRFAYEALMLMTKEAEIHV